jgi:membrane protease YdiL (CAAX protease family)
MKSKVKSFFGTLLMPLVYTAALYIVTLIGVIIVSVVAGFSAGVAAGMEGKTIAPEDVEVNISYNAEMTMAVIGMLVGLFWAFLLANKLYGIKLFQKERVKPFLLFVSAVLGVSVMFVSSLLSGMLFPDGKPPENSVLDDITLLTVFVAVLAAPVCEELVFRKFMLDACVKRGLPPLLYIILTAVIFALIHDPTSMQYMTATFLVGVAFAFCYHKSGVVLYVMVAHATYNGLAVAVTFLAQSGEFAEAAEDAAQFEGGAGDYILLAFAAAVTVLCLFAFARAGKKDGSGDSDVEAIA